MAKIATVTVQARGGAGFGAPDTSDKLEDMGNYEAAINNKEIFEMLAQLKPIDMKTATVEEKSAYQFLTLEKSDIKDFEAKSMGAAGHGINSQFAALNAPYRAVPYADTSVVAVERVVTKGKKMGKTVKAKETNCIKIYRTGLEFDSSLYAVDGWGKTNDKGEELVYESFTVGQELRAAKFLATIPKKLKEKIGIVEE